MISYDDWRRMPAGVERAAHAALAYLKPGVYGPWPVNLGRGEIVRLLSEALEEGSHEPLDPAG